VDNLQTAKKIKQYRVFFLSLISAGVIMLIVNFFSDDNRTLVTDLLYIPIPSILLTLSLIIMLRFKMIGYHGKAWILFFIFAACWFTAEQIWLVYELMLNIEPWPSVADLFYILGYPFLLAFSICYIHPVRKAITKKLVIFSSIISLLLLVPSIVMAYQPGSYANDFEILLALSYPILDAIVFCPAFIGI